jgi:non-ribosomal peptide synthetase component F
MLGLFINTLPIAQTLDPQLSVGEWLTQLQAYNLEARDHEHASLADVQRWSGQGGQALFDSIVVFENYPIDERLADAGDDQVRFGEVKGRDVTNYAMDLAVSLGSTLSIEFLYLRERFTEAACAQVMSSFEVLLLAMLDDAQAPWAAWACSMPRPVTGCSAPTRWPPANLRRCWCMPAVRPPCARCRGCDLRRPEPTYAQLEQRAAALATRLLAAGVGPEPAWAWRWSARCR